MAFGAAIYGHCGSFVTFYRCILCEANKNNFIKMEPLQMRSLNSIYSASEYYKKNFNPNANQAEKTKLYEKTKSIKYEALVDIPTTKFIPSPLHVIQG